VSGRLVNSDVYSTYKDDVKYITACRTSHLTDHIIRHVATCQVHQCGTLTALSACCRHGYDAGGWVGGYSRLSSRQSDFISFPLLSHKRNSGC